MNTYEIIGRLIVTHNQCEDQLAELDKDINHIVREVINNEESGIEPYDILLVMAKLRIMTNLINDYRSLMKDIVINGDIKFTGDDISSAEELIGIKVDGE